MALWDNRPAIRLLIFLSSLTRQHFVSEMHTLNNLQAFFATEIMAVAGVAVLALTSEGCTMKEFLTNFLGDEREILTWR